MAKNNGEKKLKITTIKIKIDTKARLEHLKEYERESYDELIKKALYILNTLRANPDTAHSILRNIDSKLKRKQVYISIPKEKPHENEKVQEKGVKQNQEKKQEILKKIIPQRFVRK